MYSLGIDLGTSTTVAAAQGGGKVTLLADAAGEGIVPSVVAFMPGGRVVVGRTARARAIIDPTNTLYSVKRIIGRRWFSPEVTEFRRRYPFELEAGPDGTPLFVTRAGKLSPTEVVRHMLQSVSQRPLVAQEKFKHVTVSVPASFGPEQREAMATAVRQAGFGEVLVIDEPWAAAAPYMSGLGREQVAAVYDLGGGTFDFAVVKLSRGSCTVLALGGDSYLGGNDIDFRLANWVADEVLTHHRWDVRTSPASFHSLVMACERAKIRLSELDSTSLPLGQVDQVLEGKDIRITRAQLETLCIDLVRRTFVVCDEVMAQAGVQSTQVQTVVMAGGGAYMPSIRQGVERYFGQPVRMDVAPDQVVGIGAAMAATDLRS
jgi:molecular chaperone DnaK